jgi:hypothetical protein
MSRLSYVDNDFFLQKYNEIFNILQVKNQLSKIKDIDITNIFDIKINDLVNINKKVNNIFSSKKITNLSSENVKYICISTSNYSSVYVVADKLSNVIFVSFRGTYSPKSATSYINLRSIIPHKICDKNENGYMLGIYKIISEIFYTIKESINYLSESFMENKNVKIITTGHSLGGGSATIFSYLFIKSNQKHNEHYETYKKIVNITFGAPRIMNNVMAYNYIHLINEKIIMFKRYVTRGDPITILPFSNFGSKSFFHPDEIDDNLNNLYNLSNYCDNYRKTKKIKCNNDKTIKKKYILFNHSSYLGITYKASDNGLIMNYNKEIPRYKNQTVCRIVVGGNNEKHKYSLFILDDAKYNNNNYLQKRLLKLKKVFFVNYKHSDIYINKNTFKKIIESGTNLFINNNSKTNKSKTNNYVKINHTKKNKQLYCM